MFTADAHCDTLHVLAGENFDAGKLTVTRERLEEGNVGLQTFALFCGTHTESGTPMSRYDDMLKCVDKLNVPIFTRELPDEPPQTPSGVLSIEGGEILAGDMNRLYEAHKAGVRMIALTWNYENEIGYPGCSLSLERLKPFGRDLVREMDKLGILTDVSHLNDAGFYDVASITELPIVASHSNFRNVTKVTRNLSTQQVKTIVEKRGFIGINFYSRFLTKNPVATLDDVLRHIDALCEIGAYDCIGFGSDFDGIDEWPEGLDNPSCFPALLELLRKHGYAKDVIEGFAGKNLWRVYKEAGFK